MDQKPSVDAPMANPGALGRCAGCRRGLADGGERAGVAAGGASTVEGSKSLALKKITPTW